MPGQSWTPELNALIEIRRIADQSSPELKFSSRIKPSTKAALQNLNLIKFEGNRFSSHHSGPRVLAIDVTAHGYRIATGTLTGEYEVLVIEPLPLNQSDWLAKVDAHIERLCRKYGDQTIAIVVSVPASVIENRYATPAFSGWSTIDFQGLSKKFSNYAFLAENNASLAGHIEASLLQTGNGLPRVCLYLDLHSHISGSLIVDGQTVKGSIGTAGEFGHMPFGASDLKCTCGSRGCWGTSVSGIGLADFLEEPTPIDPTEYLAAAIRRCEEESIDYTGFGMPHPIYSESLGPTMRGISEIAQRFGRGVAGLTNALAPDTIILSGLAAQLHHAASQSFEESLAEYLMDTRKTTEPVIVYSQSTGDATLRGAIKLGFDNALTGEWLSKRLESFVSKS